MKHLALTLCLLLGLASSFAQSPYDSEHNHFCHRCGMAVPKTGKEIKVTGVKQAPWYQCCPMCAFKDVLEDGGGKGTITAYGAISKKEIKFTIKDGKIEKMQPTTAIVLVGGSCMKNKIFINRKNGEQFVAKHDWAKNEMLKPAKQLFMKIKKNANPQSTCATCSVDLKGHEKTAFVILTKEKKRMVSCCAHCGLFMMHKLKDKVKRAITTDFVTGELIAAKKAIYVVGSKLLTCCSPPTYSFKKKSDAEAFQKKNGGQIHQLDELLSNIGKVMKHHH